MKKKIRTTRKRLLSVLLAVAMVLTALPLTALPTVAATSGDFAYWILSEEGKTCCISQYTGSETDVSIPYAIDGYTVTQIGDMESIFTNTPQVESVTIPAGVTEIWFSQDALYSPALRVVNIDPENPTYSSVDGVVFSKDKTELYLYPCAKADVTAYEIPYGVDYISVSAFGGCKNLVSITIPDSVTEIGEYAFSGCTSLESITIPDSVTSIGEDVFYGCTALTSITIPDSVTSIGGYAFYDCTALTNINIPSSVRSIGNNAFENCSALAEIQIDAGNLFYASENGVLFDKEKIELICYPAGKQDSSYTISNSVKCIGGSAFKGCTALTSVTIPDSVTSIGSWAFYNTAYYNDATHWENDVLYIGNHLIKANDTLGLGGAYTVRAGTKTIADEAFDFCNLLESITIPDSVTSIGDWAFAGCSLLTNITIPDSVTSIGRWTFYGCTALTSVTIPDSVISIDDGAFYGCIELTSITIPDSVTSIGEDAFSYCAALTSITLPDSVTSIGDWTFSYCTSLTGVTIPNSVTRIGEYAFYNCTALTSITLPDSVTSLGWYVFEDCTALTSVTIPYSVTSIGEDAFYGCTLLTTIYGYTGSYAETYANENDIPFETLGDVPLAFTYQILDDGTICITGFKGNPHVEDLIIPAVYEGYTVSGVGGSGFYSNLSLRSLTVEDGVKYIYEMAFGNCENLEQIVLPDSIEYIQVYFVDMYPSGAFYGTAYCKNPKNWDNGVLYMGNHAYTTEFIDGAEWTVFREGTLSIADMWICSQKVYIPRSVQHIGERGWFSYYSDEEEEYKSSVVYGFAGSYAETYALNRSYEFIDITPTISKPVDGAAGLIELSYDQMTVGALVDELQYQDSTIQSIAVTDKSGNEVTDMNTICSSDMIFTATYFNGTTALFTVETTQTVLTGDVNGDEKINAVDARWVLQAASGARTFDTTQTAAADVNVDGKVNAVDARWILQVASGARTL